MANIKRQKGDATEAQVNSGTLSMRGAGVAPGDYTLVCDKDAKSTLEISSADKVTTLMQLHGDLQKDGKTVKTFGFDKNAGLTIGNLAVHKAAKPGAVVSVTINDAGYVNKERVQTAEATKKGKK